MSTESPSRILSITEQARATVVDVRAAEPDADSLALWVEVSGEQAETILCVNNLSHVPQGVRLDLENYVGCRLEDVFGGTGFPAVPDGGELEITMGSRDFFWLKVTDGPHRRGGDRTS